MLHTAKPVVLGHKERQMQALERERIGLERDRDNRQLYDAERLGEIAGLSQQLSGEAETLRALWVAQKEAA